MRIVYLNGIIEEHSWHEMRSLFWHRHFVAMVLVLAGIVFVLRPYDDLVRFDILRLTVFYASSVICFLVLLVGSVFLTQKAGRVVYSWMTVTFAIVGATLFGVGVSLLLGADLLSLAEFLLVTLFNLVFGFLGEVILVSFLLAGIMRDVRGQKSVHSMPIHYEAEAAPECPQLAETPPPRADPMIDLFGSDFRVREILALSAEAHYVSVLLVGNRRKLVRGKISEAVEQLPADSGFIIHRSHWVAARALAGVIQDGRNCFVELTNGNRLAVARHRVQETLNWAEKLGLQAKRRHEGRLSTDDLNDADHRPRRHHRRRHAAN